MPRPRKQQTALHVSPGQASYVLDRLLSERKISHGEINRYMGEMQREISDLERKLESLKQASGAAHSAPRTSQVRRPAAAVAPKAKAPGRRRRRRSVITPEQLASRQLQGRYLGLIRQIPASKRGQYQKTAREKGREAAIKEMQAKLKK
jgi:hypothetical protein